jgi:hypothetical protein
MGVQQTNPYHLLIIPGRQDLGCYVQPADDKSASLLDPARGVKEDERKSGLAHTRRSIDFRDTPSRNSR